LHLEKKFEVDDIASNFSLSATSSTGCVVHMFLQTTSIKIFPIYPSMGGTHDVIFRDVAWNETGYAADAAFDEGALRGEEHATPHYPTASPFYFEGMVMVRSDLYAQTGVYSFFNSNFKQTQRGENTWL
jgi:hypothetical protein